MWGLRLSTRVRDGQRVAKEESPCQISIDCKVEFHLVKRPCAHWPQTARPAQTSLGDPGATLLMAVLEGRAPNRRPQSPTEVAASDLAAAAADVIGFFQAGLGRT